MQRAPATLAAQTLPNLEPIPLSSSSRSSTAFKCIQSDADVERWKQSRAHTDIVLFVARICEGAVGKPLRITERNAKVSSDPVDRLWLVLDDIQAWISEIEPFTSAQRFGNLAFRKWGERLEQGCQKLHEELLVERALMSFTSELSAYFLGGFGSWERLDYGSGHELSFLAWLSFLQRLGFFGHVQHATLAGDGACLPSVTEERLSLEIVPKYLEVVWTLQDRYSLEPAGSHGVWGLDDYQFVPYAIGAAQLRTQTSYTPLAVTSASHKPVPSPMKPHELLQFVPSTSTLPTPQALQRAHPGSTPLPGPPFANLYTTSIARIHSLKRGPFNEHSPILYDVATTVPNWVKVHGGMMKMWQAECLGKRPVVQHFPFGPTAFVWDGPFPAAGAAVPNADVNVASKTAPTPTAATWAATPRPPPSSNGRNLTQAPWIHDQTTRHL